MWLHIDVLKHGQTKCIQDSKRFGRFDDFFIADTKWHNQRDTFFNRAGLPVNSEAVPEYLTERLNRAYDQFLKHLPDNTYAQVDEEGWHLSVDPAEMSLPRFGGH